MWQVNEIVLLGTKAFDKIIILQRSCGNQTNWRWIWRKRVSTWPCGSRMCFSLQTDEQVGVLNLVSKVRNIFYFYITRASNVRLRSNSVNTFCSFWIILPGTNALVSPIGNIWEWGIWDGYLYQKGGSFSTTYICDPHSYLFTERN